MAKEGKKKTKKSQVGDDKSQRALRLRRVEEMIIACHTNLDIQQTLSAEWNVSVRTIRTYIRNVHDKWNEAAKEARIDVVEQRRKQLEGMLSLALEGNPLKKIRPDLKAAATIMDKLCRLDGAYSADKVLIDGKINVEESRNKVDDFLASIAAAREAEKISKKPN